MAISSSFVVILPDDQRGCGVVPPSPHADRSPPHLLPQRAFRSGGEPDPLSAETEPICGFNLIEAACESLSGAEASLMHMIERACLADSWTPKPLWPGGLRLADLMHLIALVGFERSLSRQRQHYTERGSAADVARSAAAVLAAWPEGIPDFVSKLVRARVSESTTISNTRRLLLCAIAAPANVHEIALSALFAPQAGCLFRNGDDPVVIPAECVAMRQKFVGSDTVSKILKVDDASVEMVAQGHGITSRLAFRRTGKLDFDITVLYQRNEVYKAARARRKSSTKQDFVPCEVVAATLRVTRESLYALSALGHIRAMAVQRGNHYSLSDAFRLLKKLQARAKGNPPAKSSASFTVLSAQCPGMTVASFLDAALSGRLRVAMIPAPLRMTSRHPPKGGIHDFCADREQARLLDLPEAEVRISPILAVAPS